MRMGTLCEAIQHAAEKQELARVAEWAKSVADELAEVKLLLEEEARNKAAAS
jgi:hypothetical protein